MPVSWGYVLEGPGRPSRENQEATLAVLGVAEMWHDKIKGRTSTRPTNKLDGRNDLLNAVVDGDTVYFAAPECMGVSARDAEWLAGEIHARGARLVVNGDLIAVAPGDSLDELLGAVARWQNRKNVAAYRARRKS